MRNNIILLLIVLYLFSFSSLWAEEERPQVIFSTLDELEKKITSQSGCADRDYQQRKVVISRALKKAEELLREESFKQPITLAKAKVEPSLPSPSPSFLSDFSLYSPLMTLLANPIGAPSFYLWDSSGGWTDLMGKNVYGIFGAKYGYITGDTTYHISFSEEVLGFVFSGESELEFPLDNSLLGLEAGLFYKSPYNNKLNRTGLTFWWLTDVEHTAGKMKDSDWLNNNYDIDYTGSTHPGLDIYSESDADLDTNIYDVNYVYNFFPTENIGIGPMLGYRYQKFEYEIKDCNQVGYGSYNNPDFTGSVSGNVLNYEALYRIFYLGLNTDILLGDKFRLNFQANYMPWVSAKDRDDHLVRVPPKLSWGDCHGDGYLLNINANREFYPDWLLQVGGEYTDIDTDGTQHQTTYNPYSDLGTVDDKITFSSWLFSTILKYRF